MDTTGRIVLYISALAAVGVSAFALYVGNVPLAIAWGCAAGWCISPTNG